MIINYDLFFESLNNHQKLIDIIKNNSNARIETLAHYMDKSKQWVIKAIDRINREDICIYYYDGKRELKYTNLSENGVFRTIYNMMKDTEENNTLVHKTDEYISNKYNVSVQTVQMYRAYVLTYNHKKNVNPKN